MIELTLNPNEVSKLINRVKDLSPKRRHNAIYRAFRDATLETEKLLKLNISGKYLLVRSGRLRASIGSKVLETEEGISGIIGSGVRQGGEGARVKYANIHETGGTITPKNTRFLTIPLSEALTNAGVLRFTARQLFAGETKYDGAFVWRGIIYGYMIAKGKRPVTPLFLLKSSVTIPARYYMSRTLADIQGKLFSIMTKGVERTINGNAG
jgi:phage gpG-like protein